jgi:hypothetical protein
MEPPAAWTALLEATARICDAYGYRDQNPLPQITLMSADQKPAEKQEQAA